MRERFILGIDPGTFSSAYVYWDSYKKIILDKGIWPNDKMLEIINDTKFDALVIEAIASFGMPVGREVFTTCIWIGRFIQTFRPDLHHLVYRKDVKSFLCDSMKAKDSNIRQAIIDMIGKEATKGVFKDVWSALAVAVTYSATSLND